MSGEHANFIDNFVQGDRYSMVAAIMTSGYITMCVILGSFDAIKFHKFIMEQVVCSRSFHTPLLTVTSLLDRFLK